MNINIVSKYLQILRKDHHYTQDDLAERLNVSRQAVSKWETGTTVPNLDVLLKLSKLYGLTINDIIEPKIQPQKITDFERISTIPENELKDILTKFGARSLVIASMGASPKINDLLQKIFPDIDYKAMRQQIGMVRIEEVEDIQDQIVSMINLQAIN